MSTELRIRNQAQQIYVRALSSAWRGVQLHDPSTWLTRDADAEEKMQRDPDIAHALGYRERLIAGRQWSLTPRNEDEIGDLAVQVGTELLGGIKKFTESRLLLSSAFFSGQRFARIHHEPRKMGLGDGQMRTWWVPTRLEDMDKRMYRRVPKQDPETRQITAKWERWHIGPDEWIEEDGLDADITIEHTYQDDQSQLGHGRALREVLGWCWYAKTHVFQEALQAVERFAQGVLTAKVDGARDAATGEPNEVVTQAWQDELEIMRARHVLVFDKADEVDMLQMSGEGWQLMTEIEQRLCTKIDRAVLGASLPTGGGDSTVGSLARAEVEENSTESIINYDQECLEETLTDDLMGAVWHKNYPNMVELGIWEHKPRFQITKEKRQDPRERAEVFEAANRMGLDLAKDDIYEQLGTRKPKEGEDVLAGAAPQPLGGGFGFGQPGQGQPDPFGVGV